MKIVSFLNTSFEDALISPEFGQGVSQRRLIYEQIWFYGLTLGSFAKRKIEMLIESSTVPV